MNRALDAAKEAAMREEVPVGAVIVHGPTDKVIAVASNRVMELKDPTAHAELLAIREACNQLDSERLIDCDLYVTLEPCPMCAQAISFARIRRLYFAAADEKGGGVENGAFVFNAKSCHHKPEVYGDIMAKQASKILKDFFKERR
ncbi:nucleoside deaminase [Pseudemcibacter aquimaris]|uniref:nucleoside deaminase n=1 Tax=Pseudemcibacter aquimaris TaxID=2857064 RepID=UPI002012C10B|nr:nucleoside deaminase [Pseudemcibacter aquimaris]MCC3862297.1 nucleoside deaminase [Pseudemcibacter aquimaris]WDU59045.1 nucleoside deaminase [Pseudemcibacter aquimaris]